MTHARDASTLWCPSFSQSRIRRTLRRSVADAGGAGVAGGKRISVAVGDMRQTAVTAQRTVGGITVAVGRRGNTVRCGRGGGAAVAGGFGSCNGAAVGVIVADADADSEPVQLGDEVPQLCDGVVAADGEPSRKSEVVTVGGGDRLRRVRGTGGARRPTPRASAVAAVRGERVASEREACAVRRRRGRTVDEDGNRAVALGHRAPPASRYEHAEWSGLPTNAERCWTGKTCAFLS